MEKLLAIHKKLLDFVDNNVNKFPDKPGLKNACCLLLFAKSTKTYRAIEHLCNKGIGYGEDAIILSRSLLENLINLAYIANPKQEEEQKHRAELFSNWLLIDWNRFQKGLKECTSTKTQLRQILQEIDPTTDNYKNAEKLINDEIQRLKNNNHQTTKRSWSGLGLKWMADEVGLLDFYYDVVYWHCSQIVHSHPGGIDSYIKRLPNGNINICDMPSPNSIENALTVSLGCYFKVVTLINNVFSFKLDDKLKEIDTEAANIVKDL